MHFQISFHCESCRWSKIWHSWNIFELDVTVAYQISLETNCVEVCFLVKLHGWGSATFLRKQLTALDMVLNAPLSHKLSTYYYDTDVYKDPNDYRSSCPEVFCKKGVLKNFGKFAGKHLCQSLFFNKVAALQAWLWYRSFPVNFVKFLKHLFP